MIEPVVSICCICYNQESFIKQTLDSFLFQRTIFPFEIIISDDCSSDGTRSIIKNYVSKHPNLIKDVSSSFNIGATNNFNKVRKYAKGKYIALCEGDDFWIDPLKLQKQVDYMESHKDCSMCFSDVKVMSLLDEEIKLFNHLQDRDYTSFEILNRWSVPTCTVLYRNDISLCDGNRIYYGDIFLFLQLSQHGKLHCINEKLGCYRRHCNSMSSINQSNENLLKNYLLLSRQYEYMTSFFLADMMVSSQCRNISISNCEYILYDSNSSLISRVECIARMFRLSKINMLQMLNILYVYVLKPLIKR